MSLELSKELIKINQLVGEEYSQTLVEGDIIVPDVKPDIAKILQVDGTAVITEKEVHQDKVVINGVVHFKILYAPEGAEEPIKSINTSSGFTNTVEVKNAVSGMTAQIESDIEHIEFNLLNERKMNVKAVVSMNCKVVDTPILDLVTGINGEEDIQVLRKSIKAYNIVAQEDAEFIVKEDLEVPAGKPSIKDLLKVDVKITGKDMKLINNKVIIKGEINVCSLYVAEMDDNSIQFMEHEVPFTEVLDMDGVTEEMHCELEYDIQDMYYQLKEDSDGDIRIISIENTLKVSAKASQKVALDVVVDSYSPDVNIKTQKSTYHVDEILEDSKTQATVKEMIELPADIPQIVQVYNIITKPYMTDYNIGDGRINVEGVIDTYILYLSDSEENPVFSFKQEVPFRHTIEAQGASPEMACDIKVEVDHFSYNMNAASEMEIRYILGISSKVIKTSTVELITQAEIDTEEVADAQAQPSIVIYFVQRNDTLWNIAKKYHTTIQEITAVNDIEDNGMLFQGQQLLIPKRKRKCS